VPKDTPRGCDLYVSNCSQRRETAINCSSAESSLASCSDSARAAIAAKTFIGKVKRVRLVAPDDSAMMAIGYTTRYGGLDACNARLASPEYRQTLPLFSHLLDGSRRLNPPATCDTASNVFSANIPQITPRAWASIDPRGGLQQLRRALWKMIGRAEHRSWQARPRQRGGRRQILRDLLPLAFAWADSRRFAGWLLQDACCEEMVLKKGSGGSGFSGRERHGTNERSEQTHSRESPEPEHVNPKFFV